MDADRLYNRLWEEMVYANMRANFFGELVRVYQNWDKWLRLGVLVLSSGSAATTLASLPIELRLALPVLATAASLWLFVSQYALSASDASDGCVAHGEAARVSGGPVGFNLQPHVPSNRNHRLSSEWGQG